MRFFGKIFIFEIILLSLNLLQDALFVKMPEIKEKIIEYSVFDEMREKAYAENSALFISPQKGGQENILA